MEWSRPELLSNKKCMIQYSVEAINRIISAATRAEEAERTARQLSATLEQPFWFHHTLVSENVSQKLSIVAYL